MNRILNSRSGLLSGAMVTLLGVAAACSGGSGGGPVTPPNSDDGGASSSGTSSSGTSSSGTSSSGTSSSGTSSSSGSSSSSSSSSSGGSDSGYIQPGQDGGCPSTDTQVMGVKLTFTVTWPASTASAQGTGPVNIWLLSHSTGTTMISGTSISCGTHLPDIALAGLGLSTVNGNGTTVQIALPAKTWTAINTGAGTHRTFPDTGTQMGFNPGDTFIVNPALGLLGLTDASYGGSSPAQWPAYCTNCSNGSAWSAGMAAGAFAAGDVVDDDGDGFPGITSYPLNGMMNGIAYTYPPTGVTLFATPPLADQVYIVSRNEFALSGMRMTDCNHGSGTANITLFDNHVVGCHSTTGATGTGAPANCTSGQISFLDQNRTVYGPNATTVASPTNAITGTFTGVILGPNATCSDVTTMLP
jgi:hypothetical protein